MDGFRYFLLFAHSHVCHLVVAIHGNMSASFNFTLFVIVCVSMVSTCLSTEMTKGTIFERTIMQCIDSSYDLFSRFILGSFHQNS